MCINHTLPNHHDHTQHAQNGNFSGFAEVSEADVRKIVSNSANKSCSLDPMPTWLVKRNLDVLLPSVTIAHYRLVSFLAHLRKLLLYLF